MVEVWYHFIWCYRVQRRDEEDGTHTPIMRDGGVLYSKDEEELATG